MKRRKALRGGWVCTILMVGFAGATSGAQGPSPEARAAMEEVGWRLGVQAFSFTRTTLFDAIERIAAVDLEYVEAYPGQRLSAAHEGAVFNHHLPENLKQALKEHLKAQGVTLINYGVVPLPNDEAECRQVFDFAHEMGIETIVSEPPLEAFDLIDRLCAEYGIDVAIHNHPEPSAYGLPERTLAAMDGRSARIGACVDTSHWQRTGLDVLVWLRRFEGRIKCFHLGDIDEEKRAAFFKRKAALGPEEKPLTMGDAVFSIPNVVYGEGPGNMSAWLTEVKRQGVHAVFSVEAFFERDPDDAQERIARCADFFYKTIAQLVSR